VRLKELRREHSELKWRVAEFSRYAFVLHTDESHPHVYLVFKAVSEQGVRLDIHKATFITRLGNLELRKGCTRIVIPLFTYKRRTPGGGLGLG
jgi:hypothetical protein